MRASGVRTYPRCRDDRSARGRHDAPGISEHGHAERALQLGGNHGDLDAAVNIAPKRLMTLEECMEYIQQDECIEVTPNYIRMRKVILDEDERKKQSKKMSTEPA